jgi:hypothetical protein
MNHRIESRPARFEQEGARSLACPLVSGREMLLVTLRTPGSDMEAHVRSR